MTLYELDLNTRQDSLHVGLNGKQSQVTELLYLDATELRTFDAVVRAIHPAGDALELDQTAFYVTGGGQPHDTGALHVGDQTLQVNDVFRKDGRVWHRIDAAADGTVALPEVGSTVHGVLDWERRYRLMRTHTAMHVLCGVVFTEFGAQVTGGNMGLESARMDFELEDLDPARVQHIEAVANDVIQSGRDVSWRMLPRDEAMAIPDLIRTRVNLLPAALQVIRVVEIEGLDLQADGGTHVRNTRDVGGIQVVGTRSKGRINKRLEIELTDPS